MPTQSKIAESQVLERADDTGSRRDTLDVDLQTQLLMLKKNEYYFNSNNEPQSQFMQSDFSSAIFVKSKNPFEERHMCSLPYDKKLSTVEELEKITQGTRPHGQSSTSKTDPISMAQSLKNPYVEDEPRHSRDSFNMNDPKRIDREDQSRSNSDQFQTFNTGNLQYNPYRDDQQVPAETGKDRDESPTAKLRHIISEQTMSNMKRPGKKQKEGISR